MVDRQNRQLRLAAKNFKSKAKTGKSLITGKKTTVVLLKSKIQKQKRSEELPNAMTIETLVDHHDIPAKTEAFSDLFQLVCESARSTLLEIASRHGIEWKPTDIFPYIHQDINPSEVDCLAENIKKPLSFKH